MGAKHEVVQREGSKRNSGKREGGNREDGKKESDKRAAASAMADRSGDVEVASKPAEEDDDFSRPAKRGKGPARDGGEEDVEMVGRKGVDLPHKRFSCSEVRVMRNNRRLADARYGRGAPNYSAAPHLESSVPHPKAGFEKVKSAST